MKIDKRTRPRGSLMDRYSKRPLWRRGGSSKTPLVAVSALVCTWLLISVSTNNTQKNSAIHNEVVLANKGWSVEVHGTVRRGLAKTTAGDDSPEENSHDGSAIIRDDASSSSGSKEDPEITVERVCENLFGDGTKIYMPLCEPWDSTEEPKGDRSIEAPSQLECHYNPILTTSFCQAKNVMVDPSKIKVAVGGEPIAKVVGQREKDEFPIYEDGAFQLAQCHLNFTSITREKLPHHLVHIMESMEEQEGDDAQGLLGRLFGPKDKVVCDSWEERPTLLITRYEYANLYHTYTDWYAAYQAAALALNGRDHMDEIDIVFLDGHSEGALDAGWEILFPNANIYYISDYQGFHKSDNVTVVPVCFRHAIFVPPGYRSPLSVEVIDSVHISPRPAEYVKHCAGKAWIEGFRDRLVNNSISRLVQAKGWLFEHFQREDHEEKEEQGHHHSHLSHWKQQHHNLHRHGVRKEVQIVRALFILRKDYVAHPRTNGYVSRRIQNEHEVLAMLDHYRPPSTTATSSGQQALEHGFDFGPNTPKAFVDVKVLVLEHHDVAEQMAMIQQADIVIGMHGAGLTHVVLARPGTVLLELIPPKYSVLQHFKHMCQLSGCIYKPHFLLVNRADDKLEAYPVPVEDFEESFKGAVFAYLANQQNKEEEETKKHKGKKKQKRQSNKVYDPVLAQTEGDDLVQLAEKYPIKDDDDALLAKTEGDDLLLAEE